MTIILGEYDLFIGPSSCLPYPIMVIQSSIMYRDKLQKET